MANALPELAELKAVIVADLGETTRDACLEHRGLARDEMSLRDLMSKFGFGDGDALLSRTDEDYILYVVQEAERALARAGFENRVGSPTRIIIHSTYSVN